MRQYVPVGGGDRVLIDLGGYGILVTLDENKRWYDVAYVGIRYLPEPTPYLLPADMIVSRKGQAPMSMESAENVRIWRHRAP